MDSIFYNDDDDDCIDDGDDDGDYDDNDTRCTQQWQRALVGHGRKSTRQYDHNMHDGDKIIICGDLCPGGFQEKTVAGQLPQLPHSPPGDKNLLQSPSFFIKLSF